MRKIDTRFAEERTQPGRHDPGVGAKSASRRRLRTSEALADYGVETILWLVPLSGVLVWVALALLGAGFLGTVIRRRGWPMTRVIGGGSRAT